MDSQVKNQVTLAQKFLNLHNVNSPLLLANAWDVGSAIIFDLAGFHAIASTSAGVAFAQGYADGQNIPLKNILDITNDITSKISVPFSVDIESGFGDSISDICEVITKIISNGAVGINIEDVNPNAKHLLLNSGKFNLLIKGIAKLKKSLHIPFVINARTDILWQKEITDSRVEEAIDRCNSNLEAGADCVFIPGNLSKENMIHLAERIDGPLNVLLTAKTPSVNEISKLGVARISTGSFVAREIVGYTQYLANKIKNKVNINSLHKKGLSYNDTNKIFMDK